MSTWAPKWMGRFRSRPREPLIANPPAEPREAAPESRERLALALFQHLHDGLLVVDASWRVLDANPAFCALAGVRRDAVIGEVPPLLHALTEEPALRAEGEQMRAALDETGWWRGEVVERRRDGDARALELTVTRFKQSEDETPRYAISVSDTSAAWQQREQLERQLYLDPLTQLPNRLRFGQLLQQALPASDADGRRLVVCYLDLDHFKRLNQAAGHAGGDRVLIEIAGRLRNALRVEPGGGDTVARLGGDEFALLIRAGSQEEGRLAVERLLGVIAAPLAALPGDEPMQITASVGATVYPLDRSDAETLLRHADHAMYGAKQAGRSGYLFFDPEHSRQTEARYEALGRVQDALDASEFVLRYQPRVDMASGTVLGVEALLRWRHPTEGLVEPGRFLPLVEHTRLSAQIGDWVLAQAIEQLAAWRAQGHALEVSVNVSARHLQEPRFAQRLKELLDAQAAPLARHLELEVLETAALADLAYTCELMEHCRAFGVRFALDDFGTGYSTLTYLKRLPLDVLKIDRSFVHNMLGDAEDLAIVEGVIGLARTFRCVAVAEGVESAEQAARLVALGCRIGQGNGIARPMPAEEVVPWMHAFRGLGTTAAKGDG